MASFSFWSCCCRRCCCFYHLSEEPRKRRESKEDNLFQAYWTYGQLFGTKRTNNIFFVLKKHKLYNFEELKSKEKKKQKEHGLKENIKTKFLTYFFNLKIRTHLVTRRWGDFFRGKRRGFKTKNRKSTDYLLNFLLNNK